MPDVELSLMPLTKSSRAYTMVFHVGQVTAGHLAQLTRLWSLRASEMTKARVRLRPEDVVISLLEEVTKKECEARGFSLIEPPERDQIATALRKVINDLEALGFGRQSLASELGLSISSLSRLYNSGHSKGISYDKQVFYHALIGQILQEQKTPKATRTPQPPTPVPAAPAPRPAKAAAEPQPRPKKAPPVATKVKPKAKPKAKAPTPR